MIRYLLQRVSLSLLFALLATPVSAGIRISNDSNAEITVFIKGTKDRDYRPAIKIPARAEVEIPISPGKYYIVTRLANDRWHNLGWQNYTDHRINYSASLHAVCAPPGTLPPYQRQIAEISHARTYWCSKCGREHSEWVKD